jgi:hypothetical protein
VGIAQGGKARKGQEGDKGGGLKSGTREGEIGEIGKGGKGGQRGQRGQRPERSERQERLTPGTHV